MQTLFLRTTNPSIREPSIINIIGVWSIFVVLRQSIANFLFMDHLEIFPDFNPPFCCCSLRMIISSIMDGLQTFLQNVFLSFFETWLWCCNKGSYFKASIIKVTFWMGWKSQRVTHSVWKSTRNVSFRRYAHCLKITQNVSFEFWSFFHQFLSF